MWRRVEGHEFRVVTQLECARVDVDHCVGGARGAGVDHGGDAMPPGGGSGCGGDSASGGVGAASCVSMPADVGVFVDS